MAACGIYFTVAVTEDGELLAWGAGRYGHLGLGAVLHQQQPARAGGPETFDNQRVRLAAAGFCHLAVVAEDGAVYTCGDGGNGQLGLGDGQPRRRLTAASTTAAALVPAPPCTVTRALVILEGESSSSSNLHIQAVLAKSKYEIKSSG